MHRSKSYGTSFARGLSRDFTTHRRLMSGAPRILGTNFPTMPASWDLRKRVAPVRSQLFCGSCWAMAPTSALRSLKMLAGNDPGELSVNYLLLNVGPVHESGCNGGDFDAGQNCLAGRGPCLEELSPYVASTQGIVYPADAPVAATAQKWISIGEFWGKPTPQELCAASFNGGVGADLAVDIASDSTLETYRDGVITRSTSIRVNHMVRLVGYCAGASVDANGNAVFAPDGMWADPRGAYFIGRNQWGEEWGIDGDFLIAYGVNNFADTAMLFSE
jgi:C1A family cysteine protease